MKGIIIHDDPIWGNNERATYCEFINNASYELTQYAPKEIVRCLKGEALESSKAVCSEDDTYDFETGALIALMKMCGLEKSAIAYAEIFDDSAYGDALIKIKNLKEKVKDLWGYNKRLIDEIDQKNHEIISLKALKISNESLKKDNESFRKTCERLKEENQRLKNENSLLRNKNNELTEKKKDLKKKLNAMYGYIDTDNTKPELPRTLDINGVTYRKGVSLKDLSKTFDITHGFMITGWDPEKDFISQMDKWTGISEFTFDAKPLTKREKMWDDTKTFTWKGASCVEVDRADVISFLEEIEKEVPLVRWHTGAKPTSMNPMFNFKAWHERNKIYFFIDDNYITYGFDKESSRTNVQYVTYLPPMRWDLFKKGRKIIRVTPKNFSEAMTYIRANIALEYGGYGWERVIKNNFNKSHGFIRVSAIRKDTGYARLEFMEPEDLVKKQLNNPTVYSAKKIVDWEDVR